MKTAYVWFMAIFFAAVSAAKLQQAANREDLGAIDAAGAELDLNDGFHVSNKALSYGLCTTENIDKLAQCICFAEKSLGTISYMLHKECTFGFGDDLTVLESSCAPFKRNGTIKTEKYYRAVRFAQNFCLPNMLSDNGEPLDDEMMTTSRPKLRFRVRRIVDCF